MPEAPLVVLDTMIMVSGVIGKREASDARVLEAVETGLVRLALSDDWLIELYRVFAYPEIRKRLPDPGRVFRAASSLSLMGELFQPRKQDWPSLSDPKDWWVLDLALESQADYIVSRDKAVRNAVNRLDFVGVLDSSELLEAL
jgi:putative PIN family toxin of toxin-antitoxin system